MRKHYKKKRRSCALCKPHKTNGTCRWTDKALDGLRRFEREHKAYLGKLEEGYASFTPPQLGS
jgi:hypothetical protein